MMSKLKIINSHGVVDIAFVLFYVTLAAGLILSNSLWSVISLAALCLITFRDDFLNKRKDDIKDKLESLESEISTLKLQQGIKTLK